jgi:hypothetical protein
MARARNIKPGFFKNEILADLPCETRLLFIGLWTLADREGRLEDRPKRIKAELFAFDDFEVEPMLDRLRTDGFVLRYEVDGKRYIEITNFVKHQDPHYKEKASEIPPPPGGENQIKATSVSRTQRQRILERDGYVCQACGSRAHLCIDHILPVSRGGDSSDENLQVLCMGCNTKKGNKLDGESKGVSKKRAEPAFPGSAYDVRRPEVDSNSIETNDASPSDSLYSDSGFLIPEEAPAKPSRPPAFDALKVELPSWLSSELWAMWVRHRAAIRKPIRTEDTYRGCLRSLERFWRDGISPEDVIYHAVGSGNQGLFAPPAQKRGQAPAAEVRNGPTDHERTQQMLREQSQHKRAAPPPEILARIGKAVKVPQ